MPRAACTAHIHVDGASLRVVRLFRFSFFYFFYFLVFQRRRLGWGTPEEIRNKTGGPTPPVPCAAPHTTAHTLTTAPLDRCTRHSFTQTDTQQGVLMEKQNTNPTVYSSGAARKVWCSKLGSSGNVVGVPVLESQCRYCCRWQANAWCEVLLLQHSDRWEPLLLYTPCCIPGIYSVCCTQASCGPDVMHPSIWVS